MTGKNLKPLTHNLTDEELLKLLETAPETSEEPTVYASNVVNFLQFYNIKPGEHKVTSDLLYTLYNKWSKNKLDKKKLFSELRMFLPYGKRYFSISISAFNLSEKAISFLSKKEAPKLVKSPVRKSHFESFLNFYRIKDGRHWVGLSIFYKLYDYWHYKRGAKQRLSQQAFYKYCRLYLKERKTASSIFFGVNRNILNCVKEYNEIQKQRKEEKQKKYDEISVSSAEVEPKDKTRID